VQLAKSDAREKAALGSVGLPARDTFNVHAMTLAAAQRRVEHLERALALETQRRHEEELRALLEGAAFILHRGSDRTLRHVWVAETLDARTAMLRWQSHKGLAWHRRGARGTAAKVQFHEAAVSLITSVTYGAPLLPARR
jgi:hypothetical protein